MLALWAVSALALSASAAPPVGPPEPPAASAPAVSLYDQGMDARRRGDYTAAMKLFTRLAEEQPANVGAWEGLTLTAISQGEDQLALAYIHRWQKLGKSDYAASLEAQVLAHLNAKAPLASKPAAAANPSVAAKPAVPKLSLYALGMQQRRDGDYEAALKTFQELEALDPQGGGALEGLTLSAMGLGRYEEALAYSERWQKNGDSGYIESLKARLYSKLGRRADMADTLTREIELDPTDIRAGRRLDSVLRADAPGLFPYGGLSKTISVEGLGTPSINRIIYEGRYGGTTARMNLAPGFSAIAGAAVTQTAQRNDTHGFTYFDILEQVYSGGLEARGKHSFALAQYGQSVLSDNKAAGVGRVNFSRIKAQGGVESGDLEVRGYAERAPYFLRGAGGTQFFALLREDSGRVEAEERFWGIGWLARVGIWDYSDRVTAHSESLTATKEGGSYLLTGSLSKSYQENFGAGPTGLLTIMPYDRASTRGQYGVDGDWLASLSYGHSWYRDGNRENSGSAGLRYWLPKTDRLGYVWLAYKFEIEEFLAPVDGYVSSDSRGHWPGIFWKRQWDLGPWTQLGYEHGFLDDARGIYEGNQWTAELEWFHGRPFSLTAQARLANTSVGNKSQSIDIQARWTF